MPNRCEILGIEQSIISAVLPKNKNDFLVIKFGLINEKIYQWILNRQKSDIYLEYYGKYTFYDCICNSYHDSSKFDFVNGLVKFLCVFVKFESMYLGMKRRS